MGFAAGETGFLNIPLTSRVPRYTLWPGREIGLDFVQEGLKWKPQVLLRVRELYDHARSGVPTVTGKPPENGLHLDVADGAIVVKNAGGQQVINTGQFGFVQTPNTQPVIVPPAQGIQVTMPSSISQNNAGRGIGKVKDSECAVQ